MAKVLSKHEKSDLKKLRLRPSKPLAAEAVAKGEKTSASAKDLRPLVDLWWGVSQMSTFVYVGWVGGQCNVYIDFFSFYISKNPSMLLI